MVNNLLIKYGEKDIVANPPPPTTPAVVPPMAAPVAPTRPLNKGYTKASVPIELPVLEKFSYFCPLK